MVDWIIADVAVEVDVVAVANRVFTEEAGCCRIVVAGGEEVEIDLAVAVVAFLADEGQRVGGAAGIMRFQAEAAEAVAVGRGLRIIQ